MRLPRVRFTVRAMIVAVAVVAMGVAVVVMRQRQRYYRGRADHFAVLERVCLKAADDVMATGHVDGACESTSPEGRPTMRLYYRGRADYFGGMSRKFHQAADYPWLPIPPDPPPPDWPPPG